MWKLPKNLGMLSLGVFLILFGVAHFKLIPYDGMPNLIAIIGIAAGVLLMLGK